MIQSVLVCQETYAKALLVDRATLATARLNGDIVLAEETLLDAYRTDVRPLLAVVREEMGLAPNPLAAFRASGYWERVSAERGAAAVDASGYPGA